MSKNPAPKPTPAPAPQPVSASVPASTPVPAPVPVTRAAAAPIRETREIRVSALDLDQKDHDRRDIDLLYRIYVNKRISEQVRFYQSRIKENERNADFTFASGALVMTLSSLVATVSASVRDPFWTPTLTVLSAMLPALAALMAAFRQLYAWERQATVYRETLLGLERIKLLAPDNDRVAAANLLEVYPQLVTSSETVFTAEVSQWGQFATDEGKAGEQPTKGDSALRKLFDSLDLTDEQRATVQSIVDAGKTTQAVKETHVVVETELPAAKSGMGGGQTVVTEISSTTEAGSSSSSNTSVNVNGVEVPPTSQLNEMEMVAVNGEPVLAEDGPISGLEGTYGVTTEGEGETDPKAEGGVG